jgi:hypothetical protein
MQGFSGIVASFLVTFLPYAVQAQQDPGSLPVSQEDRSLYSGQQVIHPESLSGIWETSNGHEGAIGIHLELDTTIPSDGDKQNWTPQSWQDLQVGVYERKGAEIQLGEGGYFSDSPRGVSVTFDRGRLQLHFVSQWADTPSVDLDLVPKGGNLVRGTWPPDANQAPHEATWKKMPGDSCVGSDSQQGTENGLLSFAPNATSATRRFAY